MSARSLVLLALPIAFGCSATPAADGAPGAAPPAPVLAASAGGPSAAPALAVPADPAMAEPSASTAPPAASAAAPAMPVASASAAPAAPLPAVKVANIGMHVGGGPNDAPTKEPIRRSVEPHFDDFRRCFAQVDDPRKGGDFGVDLRIDKDGGKAKVSHPRTTLKGGDFRTCVVTAFEAIDFLKPKGGTTNVSYSLRFTP
jgi:hypothetical protein